MYDHPQHDERDLQQAPIAWVICSDVRLFRLFEIELAHLGVKAVAEPSGESFSEPSTKPPTEFPPCLIIIDTDAVDKTDAVAYAERWGCPLLAFGIHPIDLPEVVGDYVRRPFPLRILESTLRRLTAGVATTASPLIPLRPMPVAPQAEAEPIPSPATASPSVRADEFGEIAWVDDRPVTLTPTEWTIFRCLYEARGSTVSRHTLAALLGGQGNSVEVYVCHLRRKLEKPVGRHLIETVRGQGYRLL